MGTPPDQQWLFQSMAATRSAIRWLFSRIVNCFSINNGKLIHQLCGLHETGNDSTINNRIPRFSVGSVYALCPPPTVDELFIIVNLGLSSQLHRRSLWGSLDPNWCQPVRWYCDHPQSRLSQPSFISTKAPSSPQQIAPSDCFTCRESVVN